MTAWIFHGVQGTGKGLLVDHIIRPIFGKDYVAKQQPRNLKAEFNSWMEKAIIVNLDEFDINDAGVDAGSVMQALKQWITDEFMAIRAMRTDHRMTDNYANFILTTNAKSALPVDPGDRRFSFGVRQEKRLVITPDEVAAIPGELVQFAGYLKGYDANAQQAHTCLENDAKLHARELSLTTIEEFADAIRFGDLEFFLGVEEGTMDHMQKAPYKMLTDRLTNEAKHGESSFIRVNELLTAYKMVCGGKDLVGLKFKKIMQFRNLPPARIKQSDGSRPEGWQVDWKVDEETLRSIGGHIRAVKTQSDLEKELKNEIQNESN